MVRSLDVRTQLSILGFRVNLRLFHVSCSGQFGTLLNGVDRHDVEVGLFLQFLSVITYNLLTSNYPEHLGAVEGCVVNLRLEWEACNLGEVDVFHSNKFSN